MCFVFSNMLIKYRGSNEQSEIEQSERERERRMRLWEVASRGYLLSAIVNLSNVVSKACTAFVITVALNHVTTNTQFQCSSWA